MHPTRPAPVSSAIFRHLRRVAMASVLSLAAATAGAAALGCAGSGSPQDPKEGASSPPLAQASLGSAVDAALGQLTLRPEQAASVARLRTALHAQDGLVREARVRLGEALAGQVRDGKVDPAALAPLVSGVVEAVASGAPAVQASMNDLHAVLDADQRGQLVEAVRARLGHGEHGQGSGAHGKGHGPLAELAQELALTPQQEETIRASAKDAWKQAFHGGREEHQAQREKLEAAAAAFRSETFDATTFDLCSGAAEKARRRADLAVGVVSAAAPVLDAHQRELLADRIVARSTAE